MQIAAASASATPAITSASDVTMLLDISSRIA
jgi:hypothetical protein